MTEDNSTMPAPAQEAERFSLVKLLVILLILTALFSPSLSALMAVDSRPWIFTDDAAQQIPPFYQFRPDNPALQDDYIFQYYLDCYPLGFKGLYIAYTKLLGDPRPLSKGLPYVLMFSVLGLAAVIGYRLGGWGLLFALLLTMLSANVYIERMSGGLPRSFGFLITGIAFLGLVKGRRGILFLAMALGAAFYPAMGFYSGICLGIFLLFEPVPFWRANLRDLLQRAAVLGAAAAVGLLLLVPVMLSTSQYGDVITAADVGEFPEVGEGGRYTRTDRELPWADALALMLKAPASQIIGDVAPEDRLLPAAPILLSELQAPGSLTPFHWVFSAVAALALWGAVLRLRRGDAPFRRLLYGLGALAIAITLAMIFTPYLYLPFRYIRYGLGFLSLFLFFGGLAGFLPWIREHLPRKFRGFAGFLHPAAVVAVLFFLLIGSVNIFTYRLSMVSHMPLFQFLKEDAEPGLVAVWPDEMAQFAPYFAERSVLLGFEVHQIFHENFVLEMRERMIALSYAYAQGNPAAIRDLVENYHVRYAVLRTEHLDEEIQQYTYFVPFNRLLHRIYTEGVERDLGVLVMRAPHTIVYRDQLYTVVDLPELLKTLPPAPTPSAAP